MKFTLPVILAIAGLSSAAVIQEDKRWCTLPGQPCWKKRDASEIKEDKRWCTLPGQPCWKVKRAAEAFANALETSPGLGERDESTNEAAHVAKRQVDVLAAFIANSEEDAADFYHQLSLGDKFPADAAPANKDKREASPWCLFPGQPCWKNKRDASAEETQEDKRWCTLPGQPCWKKREAAEQAKEDKKRCTLPGQSCWKAKRAAEAVSNAIQSTSQYDTRTTPFNPDARVKRDASPWCLLIGQGCWKRDASAEASCHSPDGACTMATRDLYAIENAARSIIETLED
jgi:hypothetical protein